MKKIGTVRNVEVYSDENIVFSTFTKDYIIVGKYFPKLKRETQNIIFEYNLLGIEYVNLNKTTQIDVALLKKLDIQMHQKGFNYDFIIHSLKERYSNLQKETVEHTDLISKELSDLSERFFALEKYYKDRIKKRSIA